MITLLIPTINRSDFIIKYLIYLKQNHFDGQVLIGDSSNEEHFNKTEKFIKTHDSIYEIKQYYQPNLYPHQCFQAMLDDIRYPYSIFICDDDILIVKTLKKCIKYLDDHPEYAGVGGAGIAVNIANDDYDNIVSTWSYPVREITADSSVDRVKDLMSNYSVVNYSLSRTEQFKKRWPKDPRNHNKEIGTELLSCVVLAAQGKVKMLDDLFVVRQMHERRILLPNFIDSILLPHWASSTTFAIEHLAGIVAEIDSISYAAVYPVVKETWINYLIKSFERFNKFQAFEKSNKGKKSFWPNPIIKSAIKSIPGSREIFRWLRLVNFPFSSKDDFTMSALLSPSSPFHEDFMPVYEVITKQSNYTTPKVG